MYAWPGVSGNADCKALQVPAMSYEVETTRRGYRLNQHGTVLSEVLATPGATNSVFDFLAAGAAVFAPQGDVGLLGFAGGGMIAPLRKGAVGARISGVDLDAAGHDLFRRVSGDWAGEVTFACEDAVRWLERQSGGFDLVIEDLSVPTEDDVVKPDISMGRLPALIRSRLRPGGAVITNLLKPRNLSWDQFTPPFFAGHRSALVIHLREFENRILLVGDFEITARWLTFRIRRFLRAIASDQAEQFYVRKLKLSGD